MARGSYFISTFRLIALGVVALTWHGPVDRTAASGAAYVEEEPKGVRGPNGLPITGKGLEALTPIDHAVEKILLRHGIPGGSLAVAKDGKLVHARGYGWSYHEKNEQVTPLTLFGLASVSKCFTALATLKLVEEGKLSLESRAFELLKHLPVPAGVRPDPRLATITVRQLLNHSGGWDREKSGDPINWSMQVARGLKVRLPITEDHLIRYMYSVRLDFDPGTRQVYSNFGYVMLGQIVAKVSGVPYEQFVRTVVHRPMGIDRARLHDREGRYFKEESRRYNAGVMYALPAYNSPWTDASGGWAASVVDLARMMTALDGSRTGKTFLGAAVMNEMLAAPAAPLAPRADGTYFGLGWDAVQKFPKGYGFTKGGSWPGVRASVKRRADGVITAFAYNALVHMDNLDHRIANDALKEVQEAVAEIKEWPKVDLFEDYR
jgi:N-acyl-D-amino-acid deacylase